MNRKERKEASRGFVQFLINAGFSKSELRQLVKRNSKEICEIMRKRLGGNIYDKRRI